MKELEERMRINKERKEAEKKEIEDRKARGVCLFNGTEMEIRQAKSLAGQAGARALPAESRKHAGETLKKRKSEKCETIVPDIPIKPEPSVWNCTGGCGFDCMRGLRHVNFVNLSNVKMANFLLCHNVIKSTCDRCGGLLHARCISEAKFEFACTVCGGIR